KFDNNTYATRKTATQFLVDLSLLITNISQLKAIVDAGDNQLYFILLTTLLSVVQSVIYLVLGSMYNIGKTSNQFGAMIWNDIALSMGVITTIVNIIIGVFDVHEPKVVV
ncbi:Ninjurin-1, partial [Blattella germanica]